MTIGKFSISQTVLHVIIWILLFVLLYPLAMTVWSSFKMDLDFEYSKWFPTLPLNLNNYAVTFHMVWRYIANTIFVAGAGCVGMLFLSSIAAFAFARMKFPGREFLYISIIALMMIPGVLSLVPSYMLYNNFGLLDTYWVLILPNIIGGSIFGVFLLRSSFEGIPEEIFEAARIDGASEFKVYMLICLPLSLAIMGTLAIMNIIGVWNDYLWPMITIRNDDLLTISAGLIVKFTKQTGNNYPLTFAGYMLSSIPLIFLFTFANRYYIEGLTSSAIKL